jgi:hypothetical protein
MTIIPLLYEDVNLKETFEGLNNFKLKTYQQKKCRSHYNFDINYANIQGRFGKVMNLENIFGT